MRRTQLLLPPDLHRRAAEAARARRLSLGSLVREALAEYLARTGTAQPAPEAVQAVLLGEAFDDPDPDHYLSVDVDSYLYGSPPRSRQRRRRARATRRAGTRSGPSSWIPARGWRCVTAGISITPGPARSCNDSTPRDWGS